MLTAVTYHFIRELKGSRYPRLKALELDRFKSQLAYLQREYRIVSLEECLAAAVGEHCLPEKAALLTFDDAYRDQYENAFPLLREARLPAVLFPPARAVEKAEVLDTNKVHFVLAEVEDTAVLVKEIFAFLEEMGESSAAYWQRYAQAYRWDGPEVVFIKRVLQRGLPDETRLKLLNRLFLRYVTDDEAAFSRDLYLTENELREMQSAGISIASHGYDHIWLEDYSPAKQQREIDDSLRFLKRLGANTERWAISYPSGSYNDSLLEILRARGAVLGFTSQRGVADFTRDSLLALPRMDTNDLPDR